MRSFPQAPGSYQVAPNSQEALEFLTALSEWVSVAKDDLDELDAAVYATGRTPEFIDDLKLAMSLWQAVKERLDALKTTWDSGRAGARELAQFGREVWGRVEGMQGQSFTLAEAGRLVMMLHSQMVSRLGLAAEDGTTRRRLAALRAAVERAREQVAAQPTLLGIPSRQVSALASRLDALEEKAVRGADVGGELSALEYDMAKAERDLIVVGATSQNTSVFFEQPAQPGTGGRCQEPGCGGRIVDGYCEVCGVKALDQLPSSPQPAECGHAYTGSVCPVCGLEIRGAESDKDDASEREPCSHAGCEGWIVDGYCNVCGRKSGLEPAATSSESGTGLSTLIGTLPFGSALAQDYQRPRPSEALQDTVITRLSRSLLPIAPVQPEELLLSDPTPPADKQVSARAIEPGTLVAGQYRVLGPIAFGGQGWVYLARDERVGRDVVLKGMLHPDDPEQRELAARERRMLARLGSHPLIVEIYNVVEYGSDEYLVTEFVPGRSLAQLLKSGTFTAAQAVALVLAVLPGLDYLHSLGLLYLDFKPGNIVATPNKVMLIDLGSVRELGDTDRAIYGTVGYAAPELASDGPSVASDVYSVGRTLLALIAGTSGFDPAQPPAELAGHDSLIRLLERTLAADPRDRFQSVAELEVQLSLVLRELAASPDPAKETRSSHLFTAPIGSGAGADWEQLPLPLVSPSPDYDDALAWLRRFDWAKAAERVDQSLPSDPWQWQLMWLKGIAMLQSGQYRAARQSFNTVYGVLPGELAPKLALALTCELSGQLALSESLYQICLATDAAYGTQSAFGLARVRLALGDKDGSAAALESISPSSSAYQTAKRWERQFLKGKSNG
ncbi:MAG: protein kinase [Propionibacteriaceae bacterium]|jgi:serine/threonine-protein kinase PknG|nr:protein kinase [Propionibacteriaceae bacterium]